MLNFGLGLGGGDGLQDLGGEGGFNIFDLSAGCGFNSSLFVYLYFFNVWLFRFLLWLWFLLDWEWLNANYHWLRFIMGFVGLDGYCLSTLCLNNYSVLINEFRLFNLSFFNHNLTGLKFWDCFSVLLNNCPNFCSFVLSFWDGSRLLFDGLHKNWSWDFLHINNFHFLSFSVLNYSNLLLWRFWFFTINNNLICVDFISFSFFE